MEYYVLKMYREKRKEVMKEQGIENISWMTKAAIGTCLALMVVSIVIIVLAFVLQWNVVLYWIGLILLVISVVALVVVQKVDEKNNLERHITFYEAKIELLDKLLSESFKIDSKDKIDELILMYKNVLSAKAELKQRREKIIIAVFSGLLAVSSVAFENMDVMGIDLDIWATLSIILFFCGGIAAVLIYSDVFLDDIKTQYEMMIKNLEDVKLMRK